MIASLSIDNDFLKRSRVATGFSKKNAFTLIEMLVVLVIIGIIITTAVMSFGDFDVSRKNNLAVQQLQQSLKTAQEQAILQPAVLGLIFSKQGYHYYRYWINPVTQIGSWVTLPDDTLSQPNAFTNVTAIDIQGQSSKTDVISTKKNQPVIYFLPNGTTTAFAVTLTFSNKQRITLRSDNAGKTDVTKK